MIWQELKNALIFFDLKENKAEDVLKTMGNAMILEGCAKPTYVRALIERERKFPTGLDIQGIGIAIPHTDACHVKQEGIALAVLKDPVAFYQMGEESTQVQVRLIFMLAVWKPNAHLKRLQNILDIIQDVTVLEQLLNAKESGEIIQIIKKKEETL